MKLSLIKPYKQLTTHQRHNLERQATRYEVSIGHTTRTFTNILDAEAFFRFFFLDQEIERVSSVRRVANRTEITRFEGCRDTSSPIWGEKTSDAENAIRPLWGTLIIIAEGE